MNPRCSLCLRWACSAIMICIFSLVGAVVFGGPARCHAAKGKRKKRANPVDRIVNRNKPPKRVNRGAGVFPQWVALFPKNYDWKEEKRVYKALDKLYRDTKVRMWEELVRRTNDRRSYCVTAANVKNLDALTFSVGDICFNLAYRRLIGVFQRHMPEYDDDRSSTLDIGISNLAKWRKKRANKPIYQLQIEAGERALRALAKDKGFSKKQRRGARKKIEKEIKKLKRTKRPVFVKYRRFSLGFFELYTPENAKRVREVLRRGSSESFDLR